MNFNQFVDILIHSFFVSFVGIINREKLKLHLEIYVETFSIVIWIMAMVLNTTFNNISVISCQSVLLVEETGVPRENHRSDVSHWQTWSPIVVSNTPRHEWNLNLQQTNRFLHQSILEISDIFLSGMQQNEGKLCRIAHISKETHVHKWHKITWIMYRIDKWHKYHKKHISIYGTIITRNVHTCP